MRILVTSDTFLPLLGGGEVHVKEMCTRLAQLGHAVVLVTNQSGEWSEELPFKVIRIPWSKRNIFPLFKTLYREAKGVDIIHAHYSYRLTALAGIVAKLRGKPIVPILHGLGTLDEPGAKFPYKTIHSIYRFLALNLSTWIISTSEDIAKVARLHLLNPSKISIIFNGLDTSKFNPAAQIPHELSEKYKGKKIILTVRRLVPKNGVHFLVESMPKIVSAVPEVKYVMIGIGRMREYIKGRVEELKMNEYIDMVGEIPNSEVTGYLALAHAVVFPSTAESTSIACAEAFAMGKSVIASRVGGLVELIGERDERGTLVKLVDWEGSNYDAPLTLPPERYEALATAVSGELVRPDRSKQERALTFAKEVLDWNVVVKNTLSVFDKILSNEK